MIKIGGEFDINLNEIVFPKNVKTFHNSFASGRHAFLYIIKNLLLTGIKHIYIPRYICSSIIDVLELCKIDYYLFEQDSHLNMISNPKLFKTESAILLVNYFGLYSCRNDINSIKKLRPDIKIILDNVQSYYLQSSKFDVSFQFNSLRKYFPVPDGAFVISNENLKIQNNLEQYEENTFHIAKMFAGVAKNHNVNDKLYLKYFEEGERLLCDINEIELSSLLGKTLFQAINQEDARHKRVENSKYIYNRGKAIGLNFLFDSLESESVPLCIPILLKNRDEVRKKLFQKRIYLPVHWPLEEVGNDDIQKIVKNELSIVIDQRYGLVEMEYLMNCLEELL